MKKDVKTFLLHVLESIEIIEAHVHNMSREEFMEDVKTQDAVLRRLEIMGEAVKKYSSRFQKEPFSNSVESHCRNKRRSYPRILRS